MVNNNLHALVIEGEPDKYELFQAFEEIKVQYADAIKDINYLREIKLYRDIIQGSVKLEQIKLCIDTLRIYYTKEFADKLNELVDEKLLFDPANPDQYEKMLKRADMRSRGYRIGVDLKKAQLAQLQAKKDPEYKFTRDYFDNIITDLEDFSRFEMNEESMTVYKFCVRVNKLNKYIESLKMQKHGKRR